jgi:iron complex outermembrane receptor protein
MSDEITFDVPAGPAAQTLPIYTAQAGLQALFGYDDVRGIETHAVHGTFDMVSALEQMTKGTRLRFEFMDGDTVMLTVAAPGHARQKSGENAFLTSSEKAGVDRRSLLSPMEEITISATPDRPTIAQASSRLITLTRSDIDSLGQPTVQDTLRTIPQIFGGGPSEDTRLGFEALSNGAFGSGVNLRGLGAGSTLVLVNGRRMSGSGTDAIFVDVASLPLSIVERIEILPDSSSTRYGADAVGGVVNFVLADTMSGTQTEAFFGAGTQSPLHEYQASQLFGMHFGSFAGLVAVDYYDRGNLPTADRPQAHSDLRRFGGDNFDTLQSNPGNVILGTSTMWAIPAGQDGTQLTPGSFIRGTQNKEDIYAGADLLPTQRRVTLFASGKMPLTDDMQLFTDLFYGTRDTHFIGPGQRTTLVVPASNAYFVNPTGVPVTALSVGYDFRQDLGPVVSRGSVATRKVVAGVDVDPSDAWHLTGTLDFASEVFDSRSDNNVDTTQLALALADHDPATALNVFGDGSHTNPATLARLRTRGALDSESRLWSGALTGMRDLPAWSGKRGSLMVGADFRRSSFSSRLTMGDTVQSAHDLSRTVSAAFVTASLPLPKRFELSVGERYEYYSDFGASRSPRLGLTWLPVTGLSLRSTWSKSLRPPNLVDLDESANFVALAPARDPSAPGGFAQVLVRGGKNAQLREERAESWTAGLDFEPAAVPSLSLALTYFDTHFRDRRDVPLFAQDILVNPTMTSLVVRGPTAAQIAAACDGVRLVGLTSCTGLPIGAIADLRVRNSAYVHTDGVDLNAQYKLHLESSSLLFGLSGTKLFSFETAESPSSPEMELVSTQSNPIDLRLLGTLEWKLRGFTAGTHVSYYDGYRDTASLPERHVRSWTTVDLRLAYDVDASAESWLNGTTFALSADNLFDRDAPFLNNQVGMGYDQENADLTGRMITVSLRKKW